MSGAQEWAVRRGGCHQKETRAKGSGRLATRSHQWRKARDAIGLQRPEKRDETCNVRRDYKDGGARETWMIGMEKIGDRGKLGDGSPP